MKEEHLRVSLYKLNRISSVLSFPYSFSGQ
jgi:hypothetical protein